ncbi:MAG: carbohydrate kinase family protein [Cypionkella sp.]
MRPIAVAGNVNVDLILGPVAPWPQPGTEVMVAHDDLRVGGAAGNAALVWQAMGLPFQCAANLGEDHFGTWLGDAFPDHAQRWPISPRRTTLSVGLTHPNGERTFFTTDGHLRDMTAGAVLDTLDSTALRGGLLLLCGSFVTEALAAGYGEIFDWADRYDIAVALDTGWPPQGWTQTTRAQTDLWLSRSKIALMNEIEAASLSGTDNVEQAAKALRQTMPQGAVVVVKRGAEGALALDADGQFHHVPAMEVKVIDTIGAGDIFNAGFLAAHARALPLPECLRHGVVTASHAISTQPRQFARPEQDRTA